MFPTLLNIYIHLIIRKSFCSEQFLVCVEMTKPLEGTVDKHLHQRSLHRRSNMPEFSCTGSPQLHLCTDPKFCFQITSLEFKMHFSQRNKMSGGLFLS